MGAFYALGKAAGAKPIAALPLPVGRCAAERGGFGVELAYTKAADRLDVPFYQSNLELPTECPF